MKKNVMMRIASVLLIAVLISTCGISGTYAKYVTTGTATDTARVAKWGVKITSTGMMFGEHYTKANENAVAVEYTGSVDTQGEVNGIRKLVAPGTKGDMFKVLLSGTPEVAVKVSYVADLVLTGWNITGDWDNNDVTPDETIDYCPIIFTVGGATYGMYGSSATNTFGSIAVLELAVEEAIAAYTKEYPANVVLSNTGVVEIPSVSWEWPFSTGADNDVKDTALGNMAADGTPATIAITVNTTVEQVD